jgi:hypothetical protein
MATLSFAEIRVVGSRIHRKVTLIQQKSNWFHATLPIKPNAPTAHHYLTTPDFSNDLDPAFVLPLTSSLLLFSQSL